MANGLRARAHDHATVGEGGAARHGQSGLSGWRHGPGDGYVRRRIRADRQDASGEVVGQQVHQETVVPGPIGAALVPAHDPHRPEARLLVGAGSRRRCRPRGRW